MTPLLAVLYARVSTADQEERGSIRIQIDCARAWAEREGVRIVMEYLDEDVSGMVRFEDRPAGARLLSDAPSLRAQGVTTILLYEWSRIGRDPVVVWGAVDFLERRHGFSIRSLTQNADTSTPENMLMLAISAGVSTYEREQILRRSRDGMNRIAREGGWLGGFAPYGYRTEGVGKSKRVVMDDEPIPGLPAGLTYSPAAVVRMIFGLSAEGWGCYRIAQQLNALGIPHAGGRSPWSHDRIREILRHPVYAGDYQWGRRPGKNSKRPREIISRAVPALVGRELWDAAQGELRRAAALRARNNRTDYLLRGLAVCRTCGRRYSGEAIRASREGYLYRQYRVRGKDYEWQSEDACHSLAARADELEDAIWDEVTHLIYHPGEMLEKIGAARKQQTDQSEELTARVEAMEVQLARRENDRQRLLTWCRNGMINELEMSRQLEEVRREEAEIRAELDRVRPVFLAQQSKQHSRAALGGLLEEIRRGLDEVPTWEQKRSAIVRLVERVELVVTGRQRSKRTHYRIVWRFEL